MSRTRVRAAMMFAFRKFLPCGLGGQSFLFLGCGSSASYRPTFQRSLALNHLRRLLPDPSRIDDEFERVRILILFHQLEIDEPFGAGY